MTKPDTGGQADLRLTFAHWMPSCMRDVLVKTVTTDRRREVDPG